MSGRVELPRTESCETCRFWKRWRSGRSFGSCGRYPPKIMTVDRDTYYESEDPTLYANQPPTNFDDWCGEYQPVAPPKPQLPPPGNKPRPKA